MPHKRAASGRQQPSAQQSKNALQVCLVAPLSSPAAKDGRLPLDLACLHRGIHTVAGRCLCLSRRCLRSAQCLLETCMEGNDMASVQCCAHLGLVGRGLGAICTGWAASGGSGHSWGLCADSKMGTTCLSVNVHTLSRTVHLGEMIAAAVY